jgi:hypothetical protein
MENSNASDIERDKVFANDKDPMEELAELRAQEALDAPEEEKEDTAAELVQEKEEEVADEATETDDLAAFDEPEDEVKEEPEVVSDVVPEESEEDPEEKVEGEAEGEDPQIYKFKADGQDFEFTQQEINDQFGAVFAKAMNYTRKMQKISPYKKMVSALEEENISETDLNLAIDVLKGDKGALQKLIAEKSIDIYDLDPKGVTEEYQAKSYGKNEHEQQLADIDREISADPEYSQTVDIIGKQWDEGSRTALSENPEWITGLHTDVKSGVFAKVAPEATKLKMLDGGSKPDIEYYLLAGQQMQKKANAKPEPVEDPAEVAAQQYKDDSAVANKKRSASSTRSRAGSKSVVDYLDDDNDEKFNSWYNNIMDNS